MDNQAGSSAADHNEIVQLACMGDRAAFDQLVHHCRPFLLALTFLRTRSLVDAEDLVQEILLRVWQKLPALRQHGRLLPWMKAIAANTCSTWCRRRPAQTTSLDTESVCLLLADSAPKPQEILFSHEKQRELHRALLRLPQANRLALLMHVWGDYSYSEIAAITEVEVTTVEGRIYRAKRQMRILLRDEGSDLRVHRSADLVPETGKEQEYDNVAAE
jgi:RNA polymerase sigma-70 factor (ECF subfamily)